MRRTLVRIALPATVLATILAGCSAGDDTSGSDATASATASVAEVAKTSQVDAADVMAENTAAHETDTSGVESSAGTSAATTIRLSGSSATVDGDGAKADGGTVTISAAGTYRISGTLDDGKIVVDTDDDGTVNLVLDGSDISSSSTSPLQVVNADDVVVALAKGTTNHLSDTDSYADDDDASGALFSSADLTITGTGKLNVDANANDGIVSKDGLVIESGDITVKSVDDGIRGKDYLVIEGGTITVDAQGDALKSDNEKDAALGYVEVAGGTLDLTAGDDGITAETDVVVSGGSGTIVTDGGHTTEVGEDESPKGFVADAVVVVSGGRYSIDAADDAVHSNGVASVTDGKLTIKSGDDAIHADSALSVSGGTVDVQAAYEGLEAAVVTVSGGSTSLVTSDDGVNGSSGSSSESTDGTTGGDQGGGDQGNGGQPPSGEMPEGGGTPPSGEMPEGGQPSSGEMPEGGPQGGGGPGGGGDQADASVLVNITGGTLTVDAEGDGLDSNGSMTMSGGTVVVAGPTDDGNGAIDYNGTFDISGGELIAVGASGMAQTPSSSSSQSFVGLTADSTLEAGTLVHVVDADGAVVASFTSSKDFSSVVYSSSAVTKGDTYTLVSGGKAGTKIAGGLSHDGDTSGATKVATGTAGEESSGSGMGGPGGGMGGPSGQQGGQQGESDQQGQTGQQGGEGSDA